VILGNIFAERLRKRAFRIYWCMPHAKDLSLRIRVARWRKSVVMISSTLNRDSIAGLLFGRLFFFINTLRILQIGLDRRMKVFIVRNQIIPSLFLLLIRRLRRIDFIFQYSYPEGDAWIAYSRYSRNIFYRLSCFLRGHTYNFFLGPIVRGADGVIPITQFLQEKLEGRYHTRKNRVFPLTMGIEPSTPVDGTGRVERLKEQYGLVEGKTLIYFGAFIKLRRIDFILEAVSRVVKSDHDVKLFLIGAKNRREWGEMSGLVRDMGIEGNVVIKEWMKRQDLNDFIRASDIGLSVIPPTEVFRISSPTKLYECLNLEKPVIANCEIHEQNRVIAESGGGVSIRYDGFELERSIRYLTSNRQHTREMGRKGRSYIQEHYSFDRQAEELSHFLNRITRASVYGSP
jgi:glycosyltransferase involved in cell wall biosynthesis